MENTDYYKEIEKKKEDLLCKEYGLIKYEKEVAGKYLKQFAEKLKDSDEIKALLEMETMPKVFKHIYTNIVERINELLKEYELRN